MSRLRIAGALCAAATFTSTSIAQQYFGSWENSIGQPATFEFYVSTTGTDSNPTLGLDPAAPLRTVTTALANWQANYPGSPCTINVEPGVYSAAGGETFPLAIPAFGLALETWNNLPGVPTGGRAVLDGGTASATVLVDRYGDATLPPSVLTGLEIRDGAIGIRLDPTQDAPPTETWAQTEIRECWIRKVVTAGAGISIRVREGEIAEYSIHDNLIGNAASNPGGTGIDVFCQGTSSTLIRGNRIHNWRDNVVAVGQPGDEDQCRPRIFSNFIQLGRTNVTLNNCEPFVVNNTIAFAFLPVPSTIITATGITYAGPDITAVNNNIWNPVAGSNAPAANDFILNGTVLTGAIFVPPPHNVVVNNIEDGFVFFNFSTPPLMVGGDLHPAATTPSDLHLTPGSALVDAGTNGAVGNLANPLTAILPLTVGPLSTRVDVPTDIDTDPRVLAIPPGPLRVDIGGDELETFTIAPDPTAPTPIDAFGNLQPSSTTGNYLSGTSTFASSIDVTGPAGSVASIQMGTGFSVRDYDQNVPLPWGNLHLDPYGASTMLTLGTVVIPPVGPATFAFGLGALDTSLATSWLEGELWLQAIAFDPGGQGYVTNRMRIELNP